MATGWTPPRVVSVGKTGVVSTPEGDANTPSSEELPKVAAKRSRRWDMRAEIAMPVREEVVAKHKKAGGYDKDEKHDDFEFDTGSEKSSGCLLYTSPSPRDLSTSRMPSSA